MNSLFDLKYAWRLLTKSWVHSLLCAIVVALSVGLALWAYLLVYSQALKPLGFPGSEKWYSVQIAVDAAAVAQPNVDAYTYQELRNRTRGVDYMGAFANRTVVLSEGEASISVRAAAITPRLLAATQKAPHLGRVFSEEDSKQGAVPVAILSFDTWKNYFAGDPNVIGKQTRIDSQPVQIVGVMPQGFFAFQDFELWQPLQLTNLARPSVSSEKAIVAEHGTTAKAAGDSTLSPLILLKDGQNPDALAQEMKVVVDDVNKTYPDIFNAGRHVQLIPALRMVTHPRLQVVGVISLMAVAILLLGCVNISMIFLARLLERSRELALRTALGASRSRLMRQSLLETNFVVHFGLVIGVFLAALGVGWTHDLTDFTVRVQAVGRDPNTLELRPVDLLAAATAATFVWLLSTLIPAWRVAKQDAALTLAGTGKGAGSRGSNKGAGILVGIQILISSLVLMICGNLVLAVDQEASKPLGLNTSQVMIATYPTVLDSRYADANQRLRYYEDLKAQVEERVTGAQAAFTTTVPTRPTATPVALDSQEGTSNQGEQTLPLTVVSDNYFELLGVKLRSGRLFDSTDNIDSLNVAVVDEKLAQRYWPGQDALGKRIQLNPTANGPWLTVVGVVSGVAGQPFTPDNGVIYRPLRQAAPTAFHLIAKMPNSAGDNRVALRAAAFAVDRDVVLHNLQLLTDYLDSVNMSFKSLVPVFVVLAIITAILAATGLFGLISRSVALRTQEVGIRRALGATQFQSISMFLRQGAIYLSVGVAGVLLGVVVINALSAVFTNILDRALLVTPSVILLMAAVIFAASYLPTRRAVALEPGDALRYE
jgi:putative ABC transport system permease protein